MSTVGPPDGNLANPVPARVAIVGAGWSGMAAAVEAARAGHQVSLFEASRSLGGRARALPCVLPDGSRTTLDNGQHILIGAYTSTLGLMRMVGIDPAQALLRLPLRLIFADGGGMRFPDWHGPWDALAGIGTARGWRVADKIGLLRTALRWRLAGFDCDPQQSVAGLCDDLTPKVMAELIEPLCVSALNIEPERASAQVFLRVLHDSVFGARGGSHLLLPRTDLSALFPLAAARWLTERGAQLVTGLRVAALAHEGTGWRVHGQQFDQVVLATPATEAARLVDQASAGLPPAAQRAARQWAGAAAALAHTAITTVYAHGRGVVLRHPLLALRSRATPLPSHPAQFVFDRGQLGGPAGLLAFVVSASAGERDAIQSQVLAQAREQLGLDLLPVQTVVEKRATFACTPGLQRPPMQICPGLRAAGDYLRGPYPATLEAAVRAGVDAIRS